MTSATSPAPAARTHVERVAAQRRYEATVAADNLAGEAEQRDARIIWVIAAAFVPLAWGAYALTSLLFGA